MYKYNATVVNVVDGDTFDLIIDLGFHISIKERVRLLDADTPEKFGEEKKLGLIVKQYATDLLLNKNVVIQSYKDTEAAKTDSFGRWLVYLKIDGEDLTSMYNKLGVNKKNTLTYSQENVLSLQYIS